MHAMLKTIGEWWNADPEAVINQALQTGGGPNVSDAYTINGLPGPLYNCSTKGINIYIYIYISQNVLII
jgi:hypothetical protein